ncbi:GNAT family N-acetyltransferase [Chitinilyticum aquatile]|uniref:GNAT family N-acetyltransferase n=1 Tax=Chitinilyticum aquatile TaxID=362520 RepID=UPI00138AB896|nr:GNAT family N-acetyltransferase [Chitinilyticum aquatile]
MRILPSSESIAVKIRARSSRVNTICETHIVLESRHCSIESFSEKDIDAAMELLADSDVRKYLGGGLSESQARIRLQQMAQPINHSIFPSRFLTVRKRETADFLGIVSICPWHSPWFSEYSFEFLPAHWGSGYAFEASCAVISHAFTHLGISSLLAETQTANVRSRTLLTRLGFKLERKLCRFGAEQSLYVLLQQAQESA